MTYAVQFPTLPIADLEPWRADALCTQLVRSGDAEPDWWFPADVQSPEAAAAVDICHRCPVIADCLAWAVRVKEHSGIWGGHKVRRGQISRQYICAICNTVFEHGLRGAGRPTVTCSDACHQKRIARKQANSAAGRQQRLKAGVR